MFLLILVLLTSIPLVSPSYHIPKLGRFHTFLRIGKRNFDEPCLDKSLCTSNQQSIYTKCIVFFDRNICWPHINQDNLIKRQQFDQNHNHRHTIRDHT